MSASCSLCSHTDREVQVLCEGRCLICSICEESPAIKKLMVNFLHKSVIENGKSIEKALCPICGLPLSRSMLQTFQNVEAVTKDSTARTFDVNIFEQESPFVPFMKRFKQTYKDVLSMESLDTFETQCSQLQKSEELPALANHRTGTPKPPTIKQNMKVENPYQEKLPPLIASVALDYMVDCWCYVLSGLQRNLHDNMANVVIRLNCKKKFSLKTSDFRIKALVDFMRSDAVYETPELYLMARLCGLQPRYDTIRPAWTPFVAIILVNSYFGKHMHKGSVIDESGSPTLAEFRNVLTKTKAVKHISLSKAIKIFHSFMNTNQPHWKMNPLLAACYEYNVQLPWGREATARLLHLLFHFAHRTHHTSLHKGGRHSIVAGVGARGFDSSGDSTPLSPAPSGGGSGISSPTPSRIPAPTKVPSSPTTGGSGGGGGGLFTTSSSSAATAAAALSSSAEQLTVQAANLRSFATRAKEFWAVTVSKPTVGHLSINTVDKVGCVVGNSLVHLDFASAEVLADSSSCTVSVSELSLVAVAAWEAEYLRLRYMLERSQVSLMRRHAITGTVQASAVVIDKQVKLAIGRIVHWVGDANLHKIDWDFIKEIGAARAFPFRFPPAMLEKSAAELNHIAAVLVSVRENTKMVETYEDLLALNEPYGTVTRKRLLLDSRRSRYDGITTDANRIIEASTSEGIHLSPEQMEIYHRKRFLEAQTLGGYEVSDGASSIREGNEAGGRGGSRKGYHHVGDEPQTHHSTGDNESADYFDEQCYPDGHPLTLSLDGIAEKQQQQEVEYTLAGFRADHLTSPEAGTPIGSARHGMGAGVGVGVGSHTALAAQGYASPRPSQHRMNLTDVIEVRVPDVLSKVHLLTKTPHTEEDEIDRLFTMPYGVALPKLLENSITEGSLSVFDSTTDHQHRALVDFVPSKPILSADALAKSRVVSRIQSAVYDALLSAHGTYKPPKLSNNARDGFSGSINFGMADSDDSMFDPSVNATQDAVQALSFKRADLTVPQLEIIIERYMNPWQLDKLRKVDFRECKISPTGVRLLCVRFATMCNLIHVNLGAMNLGDMGCKHILESLLAGGVAGTLLRLELDRNNITIATQNLLVINKFTKLRALDLSYNAISMDIARQRETFVAMLSPLDCLQSLSLAYNPIQDSGFKILFDLCDGFAELKMLDLANCFITNKSSSLLFKMFTASFPARLEVLMMQSNLITQMETAELKFASNAVGIKVYFEGEHVGIAEPLRYNVKEEETAILLAKQRQKEEEERIRLKKTFRKRKTGIHRVQPITMQQAAERPGSPG